MAPFSFRLGIGCVVVFVLAATFLSPAMAGGVDSEHEVLDVAEAAALLRVAPEVVRQMVEANDLPARRVGAVWRFSRAALLDWLRNEPVIVASRAAAESQGKTRKTESLGTELSALNARGAPSKAPTQLAQAAPGDGPPQASASSATIGERPAIRTAEEIALRDQRVLLARGAVTLDVGASYVHSEQTLFPVVRQEQRTASLNAALRYGLRDDLQLTARVPGVWRRTSLYSDASISGSTAPRTTREDYLGDASLSLLGVALREAAGLPNIIWSLDSVIPTGPGDRGLGAGLVFSKSYDPAVIFAGFSYLHGFAIDAANSRRSLAKHNAGLSVGYTYALNDALAFNTSLVGTYRNTRSPDGVSIAPPRERYQLQLGMTWRLARGLFMEPAVAMRLGGTSPDLAVSLNIPYSF